MLSIEQIQAASAKAGRKAAQFNREPFQPIQAEQIAGYPPFPFPNLGNYRPKGWELVDKLLCDSTGIEYENEPALTPRRLKEYLIRHIPDRYAYAIIEKEQFQILVGVFKQES